MSRYNKGKIFIIHNTKNELKYIGSTCQSLSQRMASHRSDGKSSVKTTKLYQAMKEIGIEHFYIELLEDCPCENKEQLERREGQIQRQHNTINCGYNHVVAGRTLSQYRQDNKVKINKYMETYREEVKGELKEKTKQYYHTNKEVCRKRYDEWYEEHKEEKKEYNKDYWQQNKAQLKEKHYAKLQAYQAQRVKCDLCDKEMRRDNLSKHKKKVHSNISP
jgi:hypothetical protein